MRYLWRSCGAATLVLTLLAVGCRPRIAPQRPDIIDENRDPRWAVPIRRPGVPNLYRVSAGLYRSGQPNERGFKELTALGVKTVINLRATHSDVDELNGAPMEYVSLPTVVWDADDAAMLAFLRVMSDPTKQPVLVHCTYGADRTGTAVALYRMVINNWSREDAIREMVEGGFGFHATWQNLIEFLEGVDVEALRKKLIMPAPLPPL